MADNLLRAREVNLDNARTEAEGAKSEPLTIREPALSMLAPLYVKRLECLFDVRKSGYDLVRSALWVDVALSQHPPQSADLPAWIVERARAIAPPTGGMDATFGGLAVASASVDPRAGLTDGRSHVVSNTCLGVWSALHSDRAEVVARRVAVAVAAWEQPENAVVSAALAEWVLALVQRGREEFRERARILKNEDGRREVGARVLEVVQKAGREGIRESELHRKCRAFRELDERRRFTLLARLDDDGEVVRVNGRQRSITLYLPRHAPPVPAQEIRRLSA